MPRSDSAPKKARLSTSWLRWAEPVTPIFLAVHGAALIAGSEPSALLWVLVLVTAGLGVAGLAGWRTYEAAETRAWAMIVLTWILLYLSGGVAAFFTLWYFMLAAVYPLILRGRFAFIYPVVIGIAYVALSPLSERALAPAVLYGRTAVITAIGLVVASISTSQRHSNDVLLNAKDQFVASVSHELRTPLTAVVGFASELNDHLDTLTPEDARDYVAAVYQHSVEVASIVEDLLVAARVSGGTISVLADTVSLNEQIERIADDLAPVHALANGWLEVAGPPIEVTADSVRTRQILRNIVVNAIKHGGPTVSAVVSSTPDSGVIEILDDGVGVPEARVADLFVPYRPLHDDVGRPDSIGLGLTVSKELAELMHGRLTYHRHDGRTRFRLELPLANSTIETPLGTTG